MTLQQINEALRIRRLDGERFTNGKASYACYGYALYVEGNGYIAFTADATPDGVATPYALTCKKYAQKIIDGGGFCSLDGIQFVTPEPYS